MANIARKIDRLNIVDTAVDLYVYALKYLTFLADTDPTVLPDVRPTRPDGIRWNDSTDDVERLDLADLAVPDEDRRRSITPGEGSRKLM